MRERDRTSPAAAARILIVEDEQVVALDIRGMIQELGYVSAGMAPSGEQALLMARKGKPDLVLMDVKLGDRYADGVETASNIQKIIDVPVIYVTGHSDAAALKRASVTGPYGYVLKPINRRELQVTIEMSLYRHATEKLLRGNSEWLNEALRSIGDAVIATDTDAKIRFLNPAALKLLGIKEADARGRSVYRILSLRESDGAPIGDPVEDAIAQRAPLVFEHAMLWHSSGKSTPVIFTAAPILDIGGVVQGCVLTLRDVTELRARSEGLSKRVEDVEQAKRMLERYFPENMVDYLVDEKRQTELQGKNVEATILFCDIRNSTAIAEKLYPREFAAFLSELFTGIMDLAYANGGSVNKLLGDGLLITFGCPFPEKDDTLHCVRFAMQIQEYLCAFNENRSAVFKTPVTIGIGIATGSVFAGNIGSPRHMEYAVLGAAVNTASRLEALTKTVGRTILLDPVSASRVRDQIALETVGTFEVRGNKEPMKLYFPGGLL